MDIVLLMIRSVLKWHYSSLEPDDGGINETRSHACEIVAWRFLSHLSEHELIDYLLCELPPATILNPDGGSLRGLNSDGISGNVEADEFTQLLSRANSQLMMPSEWDSRNTQYTNSTSRSRAGVNDPFSSFVGLNALEVATVANAKKFLSQRVVQKVVNGIWCGDIVFWDSMNVQSKKKAQKYNARYDTLELFNNL